MYYLAGMNENNSGSLVAWGVGEGGPRGPSKVFFWGERLTLTSESWSESVSNLLDREAVFQGRVQGRGGGGTKGFVRGEHIIWDSIFDTSYVSIYSRETSW